MDSYVEYNEWRFNVGWHECVIWAVVQCRVQRGMRHNTVIIWHLQHIPWYKSRPSATILVIDWPMTMPNTRTKIFGHGFMSRPLQGQWKILHVWSWHHWVSQINIAPWLGNTTRTDYLCNNLTKSKKPKKK